MTKKDYWGAQAPGHQLAKLMEVMDFEGWFRNVRIGRFRANIAFPEQKVAMILIRSARGGTTDGMLRANEMAAEGYKVLWVSEALIGSARFLSQLRRALGQAPNTVIKENEDAG